VSLRERLANYVISGATGACVIDDRLGDFDENYTVTAGELRNLVLCAFDLAMQASDNDEHEQESRRARLDELENAYTKQRFVWGVEHEYTKRAFARWQQAVEQS
jgi:hypothetical protein